MKVLKNFEPNDIEARRCGIGASDAGVILDVNSWKDKYTLHYEKTGEMDPPDLSENPAIRHGIACEPIVFDLINNQLKIPIRKDPQTNYHKEYDWLYMHVDGRYVKENRIVEIKAPQAHMKQYYGVEGSDDIPEVYLAQAIHMMAIDTDCESVEFFVYFSGTIQRYSIKRNESLINSYIRAAKTFWDGVVNNIPPEPRDPDSVTHAYFDHNNDLITDDVELIKFIKDHIKRKEEYKKLGEIIQDDNLYIKKKVGKHDGVDMGNGIKTKITRVSLKQLDQKMLQERYPTQYTKCCTKFDEKSLKAEWPKIYEKCSNIKKSSRLILPKN